MNVAEGSVTTRRESNLEGGELTLKMSGMKAAAHGCRRSAMTGHCWKSGLEQVVDEPGKTGN
jgi:hypothetical protein